MMNREVGFGRKMLSILEDYGVAYEHTPSGIDDVTFILRQDQMSADEANIVTRLKKSYMQMKRLLT